LISSNTTVRRTQSHTVTCLEPSLISTTTVQWPLSSTVPSLAPSYSTTTFDEECILLFRLVYRVDIMYRVDRKYRMLDTILSLTSTGLLVQSGSEHYDRDDLISITTTV
jgi:hypothetical protein